MPRITVADLREMIAQGISETIEMHRLSRLDAGDTSAIRTTGDPTDDEIDDFVASNPLFDSVVWEHLLDPGPLGFQAKTVRVTSQWVHDFTKQVHYGAHTDKWLAADLPWEWEGGEIRPADTTLWTPATSAQPTWIARSPGCLLLAADLLRSGRLLSELSWRGFEELIGTLLESEGWSVNVTRPSKDGGIDVIATKHDSVIGEVRSLWQAKKYGLNNKVALSEVRELSAVRDDAKATKAVIVTTSHLTRGAIEWVKRDLYRLSYKDREQIERWVKQLVFGE